MRTRNALHLLAITGLVLCLAQSSLAAQAAYRISGPYTHANLEVFLIHGKESLPDQKYLTLGEALKKKIVVVHETGNVQQLAIENTSRTTPVFIQSGDIVKGGRQDRVISLDVIVPPRSGKLPLNSFCVEAGRWTKRGKEASGKFTSNTEMLSSNKLRLAAKYKQNQGMVWSSVAEQQKKINENLRAMKGDQNLDVTANASGTSLQLTLENKELKEMSDEYVSKLKSIVNGKQRPLGFAFLINGELKNADLYGRADLFAELWPKLLKAAVVEAISDYRDPATELPTGLISRRIGIVSSVMSLFTGFPEAEKSSHEVNERTKLVTRESEDDLLFETIDTGLGGKWLHRNYIAKGKEVSAPSAPTRGRGSNNEWGRQINPPVQQRQQKPSQNSDSLVNLPRNNSLSR